MRRLVLLCPGCGAMHAVLAMLACPDCGAVLETAEASS